MSTIKVTNLQDTSGSNSSTSEEIFQGRAKAWVSFNGTGTVAIRDDFNVDTITDNGTGDYTVNFDNAMSNSNYSVAGSVSWSTTWGTYLTIDASTYSTTAVRIRSIYTNSSATLTHIDSLRGSVQIFGD